MRTNQTDPPADERMPVLSYGDRATARRGIGAADAVSAAFAIVVALALGFIAAMLAISGLPSGLWDVLRAAFCLLFAGLAFRAAWNHLVHGGTK